MVAGGAGGAHWAQGYWGGGGTGIEYPDLLYRMFSFLILQPFIVSFKFETIV